MSELKTWGSVGYGTIGQELVRQITSRDGVSERLGLETHPDFIVRQDGYHEVSADGVVAVEPSRHNDYYSQLESKQGTDVVFVSLPSSDNGNTAYRYIAPALLAGKTVITAEKGALANHFEDLRSVSDNFRRLGHNATVGGGTNMIDHLRSRCIDSQNINEIHLALNGTLTFIFSQIAGTGSSPGEAVQQARQLGYAEPGDGTVSDIIKAEAEGDIPKKIAILFNRLGLSNKILLQHGLVGDLSTNDIDRATREARIRRFIVSIYPESMYDAARDEDTLAATSFWHDGWRIITGFPHMERSSLYGHLLGLTSAGNGYAIGLGQDNTDGVYRDSGPGAGARPTVNTMLDDWLRRKDTV